MSAQAGIFYFDGRPIQPDVPRRLDAQLAEYGPDGSGHHVGPGLVMVHRALHVTPEDELERQPYVSARGNVMTWDGRLDNREDLLLQLWRDLRDDTTDVALAMAAYEKWGTEAFEKLIGDWSLALWSNDARTLTLASDFMGNRGLFYSEDDRRILWSSSLGALADIGGATPPVSARFVAGYLSSAIPPGTTPYEGVFGVSPAHWVTWTRREAKTVRRFWDISVGSLRYRDPREYEVQLREIVGDAIRTRLRSIGPVWAELSGGFDSSTLVCMANLILRRGLAKAPALKTVSYFTKQRHASNEVQFIEAVEEECGLHGARIALDQYFDHRDPDRESVTPFHPAGVSLREYEVIREDRGRVLLSGAAGDAVLGNIVADSTPVVDALVRGRVAQSVKTARAWSRACGSPIWQILWAVAWPLLVPRSTAIRVEVRRLQRSEHPLLRPAFVELVTDELRRRIERAHAISRGGASPLARSILGYVDAAELQPPTELPGLCYSLPFVHRPLIEFVLALPPGVLYAPGEPRALMKRAFDPILPPRVARRISKGYAVEPFRQRSIRAFTLSARDRIDDLHLVKRGFIEREPLARSLAALDAQGRNDVGILRRVVKLEQWLQAMNAAEDARTKTLEREQCM